MIPVNKFKLLATDRNILIKALKNNWISSAGPEVKEFENKFKKLIGHKYCSSVSSGSAALDVALKVIDIKKGDEVIIPNFTIISSAISVVKLGGTPIPIDCDFYNWNMKILEIEKNISKKTKAIIATHIYGYPIEIDKIKKICNKYKLILIEDAAEMLGHKYNGKFCGSFGDLSIFSLYSNKHITTGEGGMLLTSKKKYSTKIFDFKNLCFGKENRFNHYDISWNYRYTNIQASLGLNQLKRIDKIVKKKHEIGNYYFKHFKDIKNVILQPNKLSYCKNIYWVFGIVIKKNNKNNIKEIIKKLTNNNIGTRPFFWPMHKQDAFKKKGYFKNINLPNSEFISKNGFYLPSGLGLTLKELKFVKDTVLSVLK